ncbi:MAG: hypothetical protein R3Y09_08150 [Clostridia bacterium]
MREVCKNIIFQDVIYDVIFMKEISEKSVNIKHNYGEWLCVDKLGFYECNSMNINDILIDF